MIETWVDERRSALPGAYPSEPSIDDIALTLSRVNPFFGLDIRVLRRVALCAQVMVMQPGQVVIAAEEANQVVYLVVEGEMRVSRLSLEGREYALEYYGPGQLFNLVTVFGETDGAEIIEAVTGTVACAIPSRQFREIVREDQALAMAVMETLAHQVRRLYDSVEDLALHTVRTRLARFLLSLLTGHSRSSRLWTQEEIAARVGTVRDCIGRELRALSDEGLVRREQGRLVVSDQAALRRVAMCERKSQHVERSSGRAGRLRQSDLAMVTKMN